MREDAKRLHPQLLRRRLADGQEVDVPVAHVERQRPALREPVRVEPEGLARDEVVGDRVAAVGVDHEDVVLRRPGVALRLKRLAGVAQDDGHLRLRLRDEGEVPPRRVRDLAVDLVEQDAVAFAPVVRHDADSHADYRAVHRLPGRVLRVQREGQAAAQLAEVGRRPGAAGRVHRLVPVHRPAVEEYLHRDLLARAVQGERVAPHLPCAVEAAARILDPFAVGEPGHAEEDGEEQPGRERRKRRSRRSLGGLRRRGWAA